MNIDVRDAHRNPDAFDFALHKEGVVQFSFGPTHICLTVDAAYEFQHQLAAFLAEQELALFPAPDFFEEPVVSRSREVLVDLAAHRKTSKKGTQS